MRHSLARMTLGLACSMTITIVAGCGADPAGPPPGPGAPPIVMPEAARTIFMITPGPSNPDAEGWVVLAQLEANLERVIFRKLGPGPGESSAAEPGLIRRAMADGASALIVVATDAPGLPEALAEAESKQVPVVVVGRSIPAPPDSPPFTTVLPRPFDASAERLVQAALGDARKAGLPDDGTALILVARGGGDDAVDRAVALEAAATRAGLKARRVEFDPPAESPSAAEALKNIQETPDLTILLAANETAMQLATQARKTLSPRVKVFVAGYTNHSNASMPGIYGSESAFVDYRSEEMGRLAVRAALDRLKGEGPGRKVEFDPRFRRGLALDSQGPEPVKPIDADRPAPKSPDEPGKTPQ